MFVTRYQDLKMHVFLSSTHTWKWCLPTSPKGVRNGNECAS
jgi:hypothetical protein